MACMWGWKAKVFLVSCKTAAFLEKFIDKWAFRALPQNEKPYFCPPENGKFLLSSVG